MTEKMMNRLKDLKDRQATGEHMLCPRCGQDTMKADLHTNALSRHVEGVYLCDSCGTAEALLDFMKQELPLTQWALFRPLRPASGFKNMDPLDVAAKVEAEQLTQLTFTFAHCTNDPDHADEYRASAYTWYRRDKDGNPLDNGAAFATGKVIYVDGDDVDNKTVFVCEVE